MANALEPIEAELLRQKESLDAETTVLETSLRELNTVRNRVAAALAALRGKSVSSANKRSTKAPTAPREEGVDKAWMIATMTRLLDENGAIPLDDLKALALDRVREEGRSLSGAALAFNHAIKDRALRQKFIQLRMIDEA